MDVLALHEVNVCLASKPICTNFDLLELSKEVLSIQGLFEYPGTNPPWDLLSVSHVRVRESLIFTRYMSLKFADNSIQCIQDGYVQSSATLM